jgi:bifunctional non-homologous end joining protein LigD
MEGVKLPAFGSIAPQLATLVAEVPTAGPWVYEIKYDGYRAMAWLEDGVVRMASRRALDWTHTYREIARALARVRARTAIFDGEVAYVDDTGRTNFEKLQNAVGSTSAAERAHLVYYVFDLLYLDGVDLRSTPLGSRKDVLRTLLAGEELPLRMSDDVADGKAFFREVCKHRLEGVIGKRTDRPYVSGRAPDWIKLKCQQRQELVIVGFTPQKDTLKGLGALVVAVREGGGYRYAGKVGTGFTQATLRDLHARLAKIAVPTPTVRTPARLPHVTWVRPELVAEVRFTEWTSEGILRHPAFLGLREDKPPTEVVAEIPREVEDPKGDLVRYYERTAESMLPLVAHRPLVVMRGQTGGALELPSATVGRGVEVPIVTRASELAALGQADVVELQGWGSRLPRWDRPDWLVFDLDRDEDMPFARVVEAAFELREALRTAHLEAWVQTTGGTGLHVVVPFARSYDWATALGAAKSIAVLIAGAAPDRYAATKAPDTRTKERITIGYGRNVEGGTAILPYSPRARAGLRGVPVATPLAWDELRGVDPVELTIRTVPERLAKLRRSPWADLLQCQQTLPKALLDAARTART